MLPAAQGHPQATKCRWCHDRRYVARGWALVCLACDVVPEAEDEEQGSA